MFSRFTKEALISMVTDKYVADEIEKRLFLPTISSQSDATNFLLTSDYSKKMERKIDNYLAWGVAGSGQEGAELSYKINKMIGVLRAKANGNEVPAVAATATLNLTADIILTSVATGTARNTNTFTIQVLAAAANPTDTVLVAFTGTAAAIVCTVTPNDGTNNGAVAVDLTTEELVELINTGAVVGKDVTLTDASSYRALQTATGGDATALADGGEGDGIAGTFSGGAATSDADIAATQAIMGSTPMSDNTYNILVYGLTSQAAAAEFKAAYNAMITAVQAIT